MSHLNHSEREIPPECARLRAGIAGQRFNEGLILEIYRDRKEGRRGSATQMHLIDCEACLDWLGQQVEPRYLVRAQQAAEYCCLSLWFC
ncbi:hypothetical protein [Parachitinimonas caeni]|uniref:Uncharacterized protein n=1 Tax=Parachitinimonas caeni TaxID=3031301 RepID=A0ABT7E3R7_9NEIS|nr:hypothetical protein [Parachitinimonas caeni]MDK2126943.1 hypothetical protein [Parachitinimonas caeni]